MKKNVCKQNGSHGFCGRQVQCGSFVSTCAQGCYNSFTACVLLHTLQQLCSILYQYVVSTRLLTFAEHSKTNLKNSSLFLCVNSGPYQIRPHLIVDVIRGLTKLDDFEMISFKNNLKLKLSLAPYCTCLR